MPSLDHSCYNKWSFPLPVFSFGTKSILTVIVYLCLLNVYSNGIPLDNTAPENKINVAILSFVTPDYKSKYATEIATKECYSRRHGYTFILHSLERTDSMLDGRTPHWGRIPIVYQLLPEYDWVFYTDADTIITNSDVKLEEIINNAVLITSSDNLPFLIVQDGEEINSGGFFIRNDPQSYIFLDSWWNMYSIISQVGYMKSTQDQPALMLALLYHEFKTFDEKGSVKTNTTSSIKNTCDVKKSQCKPKHHVEWYESFAMCTGGVTPSNRLTGNKLGGLGLSLLTVVKSYWMFVTCWNIQMSNLGLKLGKRNGKKGVVYYSTNSSKNASTSPRGFNMVNAIGDRDSAIYLYPPRIWRPGDLLVHVTNTMSSVSLETRLKSFTEHPIIKRVLKNLHSCHEIVWMVDEPICVKKPCVHDLWDVPLSFTSGNVLLKQNVEHNAANEIVSRLSEFEMTTFMVASDLHSSQSTLAIRNIAIASISSVTYLPKELVHQINTLGISFDKETNQKYTLDNLIDGHFNFTTSVFGYKHRNHWINYSPPLPSSVDESLNISLEGTGDCVMGMWPYAQTLVSFTYHDSSVRRLLFRMVATDHFPSRFRDFVALYADLRFYWYLAAPIAAASLEAVCLPVPPTDWDPSLQLIPRTWALLLSDFESPSLPSVSNLASATIPNNKVTVKGNSKSWNAKTVVEFPFDGSFITPNVRFAVHVLATEYPPPDILSVSICMGIQELPRDGLKDELKNESLASTWYAMPKVAHIEGLYKVGCVIIPKEYPYRRGLGHVPISALLGQHFSQPYGPVAMHIWSEAKRSIAVSVSSNIVSIAITVLPVKLPSPPTAFPDSSVCISGDAAGPDYGHTRGSSLWFETNGKQNWYPAVTISGSKAFEGNVSSKAVENTTFSVALKLFDIVSVGQSSSIVLNMLRDTVTQLKHLDHRVLEFIVILPPMFEDDWDVSTLSEMGINAVKSADLSHWGGLSELAHLIDNSQGDITIFIPLDWQFSDAYFRNVFESILLLRTASVDIAIFGNRTLEPQGEQDRDNRSCIGSFVCGDSKSMMWMNNVPFIASTSWLKCHILDIARSAASVNTSDTNNMDWLLSSLPMLWSERHFRVAQYPMP